jgi:hypothetical protein
MIILFGPLTFCVPWVIECGDRVSQKLGNANASYVANGALSVSSARSTNPFQANRRACKVAAA